jgi:hypothetical protein
MCAMEALCGRPMFLTESGGYVCMYVFNENTQKSKLTGKIKWNEIVNIFSMPDAYRYHKDNIFFQIFWKAVAPHCTQLFLHRSDKLLYYT